jgi:hypothetical protein
VAYFASLFISNLMLLSQFGRLQLRCVYFDRIERQQVEGIIASIYEHVKSLEDIQFLIQYATQVDQLFVSCDDNNSNKSQ